MSEYSYSVGLSDRDPAFLCSCGMTLQLDGLTFEQIIEAVRRHSAAHGYHRSPQWWLCPNEPRCPHGAILHDVEEMDDPSPTCCAEGCGCGHAS